jgi:hypothetical protein
MVGLRLLAGVLALAVSSFAQVASSTSLVGTVSDTSGKVIPNVAITAVESATLTKYATVTNQQGYYSVEFPRVGTYNITAESGGFQKVTKTGVLVENNQSIRTDITLTVGAVSQSVTIQAEATAIKTDEASVSEVLGARAIADLPLNGRDPMQLATSTPGVLPGIKSSATGIPPGEDFNGAGTREIQNSLSLDGISIMNNLITTTPTRPMVESIQEVEVQTGTYSAQYGAYLGVHINMVTKAGTNDVHGALVEFLRNQVLDARAFFTLPTPANPTAAKPPLRQNQFGFELDGPVVIPHFYNGRNKTFFMASYEGYRLVQQVTSLSTEMPAAFFTGDFSSVPATAITGGAIKDPLNGNTPFSGNKIPANRLSPIIAKLQPYYPAANLGGLTSNYSVPVQTTIGTDQTLDRIDQNIGDKIRLNVRAHYQNENVFAGNAIPVNASTVPVNTTNYTVGYTHTLTPALVNDMRIGRNRLDTNNLNYFTVQGKTTAGSDLGIAGFTGDVRYNNPGIPEFNVTGFNGLGNSGSDWYQTDSTYQFSEQLSWNRGAHNIIAGVEFRRLATAREATNSPRGAFNFNGTLSGYAPADFVLGNPQTFSTPGPEVHGHVVEWRDGFFVLDKWQVNRKLTLNYGLRYELPTVPYTANGNATELNRDQTALVGGTKGFHFTDPNRKDWAPRVGFAYRFDEKTVFRGGGGIYYNPNQTNSYTFFSNNPPFATILNCTWSVGLTPISLNSPFSSAGVCPSGPSVGTIATAPWYQPTPRMNQWSAGLERQLWSGGGLELQYLGSHSYHLDRSYFNNTPLQPGPGSVNTRRPNPKFGVIRTINNDEIANYESMSVIYRQRMKRGLQVLASYTWSHTLDISSDSNGGGTPLNPYRWRDDYGNSNWDIRHRFVMQFVYEIPFFATTNPVLSNVFKGWQGNGIVTLQTGLPFNVSTGTDTANTSSGGTYRPNLVHAPSSTCGRGSLVGCIDASSYTIANLYPAIANYAYGNEGRNLLHGPGAETVNFSVFKYFPIKERLKFQLRFETFALLNHTNFSNPSATINTGAFGTITGATGNRNIQIGGKLQF